MSARRAPAPGPRVPVLVGHGVEVREGRRLPLPATTLGLAPGEVTLAAGEPELGHTLLALALAGRFGAHGGRVLLRGHEDPAGLRREVALVDVPGVTEPDPQLRVATVVAEGLALMGEPAGRRRVAGWLDRGGLAGVARLRVEDLTTPDRLRLLSRLALHRHPGFVLLVLPERHGGDPATWWAVAEDAANSGAGVLVTASHSVAAHLPTAAVHLGNDDPSRPEVSP
ncbi:hypothetical protein ACFP3Q_07260 [Nocardioides sp. GCM10027113]|uniref:hypothetical protein n=1 Tax=unclassified Nocardioides TaxID=2615069 RepID=UPI00360E3E07